LRSKQPLKISIFNDSLKKEIKVKSKNSFAFWLNAYYFPLCPGFIVDWNNPKRYTYPNYIYMDIKNDTVDYLTYKPLDSKTSRYKNILKITPLKVIGIVNPGIELIYERKISQHYSAQIMVSYLLPRSLMTLDEEFNPKIKGYRTSIEGKYYFRGSGPMGSYFATELNYMNNDYKEIWSFGNPDSIRNFNYFNTYNDSIRIRKQSFSINFKIGYQYIYNHLSIDLYGGAGPRFKNVKHYDKLNPLDIMEPTRHPNVFYISNKEGKYWTISMVLNFRIGYNF